MIKKDNHRINIPEPNSGIVDKELLTCINEIDVIIYNLHERSPLVRKLININSRLRAIRNNLK